MLRLVVGEATVRDLSSDTVRSYQTIVKDDRQFIYSASMYKAKIGKKVYEPIKYVTIRVKLLVLIHLAEKKTLTFSCSTIYC